MNYLAHIYLARHSDDAMLGALLGDFVKPHGGERFSAEIEAEIVTHRKVDSFTDSHPIVLDAKALFEGAHRRYAGILLDVFYDHLLATHWARYADVALPVFIARFYAALARRADTLPANLARAAPYMIEQDWLGSYLRFEGVETAVCRISTRLSKNGHLLREGLADLQANYAQLETGFHAFFPELIAFAESRRTTGP
ncbi:ACP phosphodiesterase [Massilia sp. TSP1-1-2]|uniref:acyl carrier protein phosphodiesterase n=1 Tax=unclassified Massilia TaxID=2609279 RepID=UPI003CEAEB4F